MHAVPGGPFMGEKAISAAAQASLEAKYGLDKPLMQQYFTYLKDVVTRFDFGPSLKQRGRMVVDIIADGMKTSAKLGVIAACLAALVGIPLGAVAALRRARHRPRLCQQHHQPRLPHGHGHDHRPGRTDRGDEPHQ